MGCNRPSSSEEQTLEPSMAMCWCNDSTEKELTPNNVFDLLQDSNPVRFIAMKRIEEREVNIEGVRSHRFPSRKPQALFSCRNLSQLSSML